jgi:2-desacetyl-2-hydroxyethyl bacteriochlorophyllide A dehydrogenase
MPERQPDEVLVDIDEIGICGTDLKILHSTLPVEHPLVLGHELIGRVAEPGASDLALNQRVLVVPATWCGHCRFCRSGRANLCEQAGRMGIDIPGGAVDQLSVVAERLIPVPDTVPKSSAVLLQVLGTCVHAQKLVSLFPGQRAAVVGLGVGGLMHVQLLRARGLDVTAVGRSPSKLRLALEAGASAAISTDEARELASDPRAGFDVVVEAAGVADSLRVASDLTGAGGTLLVFGIHGGDSTPAPFADFYLKELTVVNARGATALDYEETVHLGATGAIDLTLIPTRRYPLDDAVAAFAAAEATTEVVKLVLER